MKRVLVLACAAALVFASLCLAFADVTYDGYPSVRYKSFANTGSNEVYLGVADLGVGANRVEKGYTWPVPVFEDITFEYIPQENMIVTEDGFGSLEYTLTDAVGSLNIFQIGIADRDVGGQVDFLNVYVNNVFLGDFYGNGDWLVHQQVFPGLEQGFLFAGTIHLDGTFTGGSESSKVEIKVGYDPAYATVPIPAAVWLFGSGLIGVVAVRRKFKK